MINTLDQQLCCGCSACVQICPKKCISLEKDREGFSYPRTDMSGCIDCGLCEKVCPALRDDSETSSPEAYAFMHGNEEVRNASSSGGLFTLLAETVINMGGVVFGARFDDQWQVELAYAETLQDLALFRGSKYVQARVGDAYMAAETFLKQGRLVLFSGSPCQIMGLKLFLKKEYDNLLTVDFVCHGVPSPLVWSRYLEADIARKGDAGKNSVLASSKVSPVITGVNFRDKSTGWKKFSFVLNISEATAAGEQNTVLSSIFDDNVYMRAFLSDLSLRPSCYRCPAKGGKSGADITMGDFWGIEKLYPELDDDKGTSLVLVNSIRGREYITDLADKLHEVNLLESIKGNSAYRHSVTRPVNRDYFFRCIRKGCSVQDAVRACESSNLFHRMRRLVFRKFGI